MPRNEAKRLSAVEIFVQLGARDALEAFMEQDATVEVKYTKRNGDESYSKGKVQFFNGRVGFDTGSVTLDTTETKGRPTTVNLHRIIGYRRVK